MSLRLIVSMEATHGRINDLIEAYRIRCEEVRHESGCEQYELYQSTERPNQVVLLEKWSDEGALQDHIDLGKTKDSSATRALRMGDTSIERYAMD